MFECESRNYNCPEKYVVDFRPENQKLQDEDYLNIGISLKDYAMLIRIDKKYTYKSFLDYVVTIPDDCFILVYGSIFISKLQQTFYETSIQKKDIILTQLYYKDDKKDGEEGIIKEDKKSSR